MSATSIPIREASLQILHKLSEQTGQSAEAILDQALAAWERKVFLDEVNAAYAAVRADPVAWAEVEAERASMAGSLQDGLDVRENWGEDGNLLSPGVEQAIG